MSVNTYLHSHMVGFPCNKEQLRTGIQIPVKESQSSNSSDYNAIYEMSNSYLSNGYTVLYGAESIPNESTTEKIVENIVSVNPTQEVQDNLSRGLLLVFDRNSIYEECDTNYKSIVNFWNSNVNRIRRRLGDQTKGTMIFSAPDSYFKHDKHDIFMMFEEEMGKTFPTNTGMVCWYKEEWINSLSLASLIKVLITHKYTIHNDWKYKAWNANEIINLISKGIDKRLGEGSSTLLFQAMKIVHKLNQDVIVSRPVIFEGILKRLLGNDQYASPLLDTIFEQIIKKISFYEDGSED
jgi:hypothetical protein